MKKENIEKVNILCREIDQLNDHAHKMARVITQDLPADQFELQQAYMLDLQKTIKKKEKELSLL